jgi:hypothetical protein
MLYIVGFLFVASMVFGGMVLYALEKKPIIKQPVLIKVDETQVIHKETLD